MYQKNTFCGIIFLLVTILITADCYAQRPGTIQFRDDVTITVDRSPSFKSSLPTQVIFFALPNGNTTAQTMGKLIDSTDDWHYDIQHIKAQTEFLRTTIKNENLIVVYVENNFRSWPLWKSRHSDHLQQIQTIIDSTIELLKLKQYSIHLNGHSGGGSFIFGYMAGIEKIPAVVKRITFIDSNYGYDSSHTDKFKNWLSSVHDSHLTVYAYNDSVVIYNGKPLVSPTGGTWYRSRKMIADLSAVFPFTTVVDSMNHYSALNHRINFYLKENPEGKIFHTQQVELNGFIHSVLIGTPFENKRYQYFGKRAYTSFISR
jgi:hypothetical protein